jgi:cytidylate kinase
MRRITVAVDGPAGSGKSSVSKEVASALSIKYVDSGALYRSLTWYFLSLHEKVEKDMNFSSDLPGIVITQEFIDGKCSTFVNGDDVSGKIRNERIARNIGIISDNVDIRNFVNKTLRSWAEDESIIMDGRDIGTVVFPDAEMKIYLDADVEARAMRRIKEYREMGKNLDENEVKKQIIQRDKEDMSRVFGKLQQAEDAIYIDTSHMSKESVIEKLNSLISDLIHR